MARLVLNGSKPITENDQRFIFGSEWQAPNIIRTVVNHIHGKSAAGTRSNRHRSTEI